MVVQIAQRTARRLTKGFRAALSAAPAPRAPALPPFRRRVIFEALEPRLLLSADLPVLPPQPDAQLPAQAQPVEAAALIHDLPAPLPVFDAMGDGMDAGVIDPGALAAGPAVAAPVAGSDPAGTGPVPEQLVIVDPRVAGALDLPGSVPGVRFLVLAAGEDGLRQITDALAGESDLAAIHVLTHGATGLLDIAGTLLDAASLAAREAEIAAWGKALAAGGDILLYGCDVAQGAQGLRFLERLAAATGADVAASTDATGAAARGGDWHLEASVGAVETAPLAFHLTDGVLADFVGTSGNDNFSGTGGADNFSFSIANLAATDTVAGGAGADALIVTSAGTITDAVWAKVTGVETLQLAAAGNTAELGATVDAAVATATGAALTATGGAGADTLAIGDGWAHAVTFDGAGGSDTLDFSGYSGDLAFTVKLDGSIVVKAGATLLATATHVENLIGGGGDNVFTFEDGAVLAGALTGGSGGANTLDHSANTTGITANLAAGTATGVGGAVSGIQNVTGGTGDDEIAGDGEANELAGGGGADTLAGGAGDDSLAGGSGDDTYLFAEGWGDDVVTETGGTDSGDFSAVTSGIAFDIGVGTLGADDGADVLSANGIENLTGGSGDDVFAFAKSGSAILAGDLAGGGSVDGDVLDYSSLADSLDLTGSGEIGDGAGGDRAPRVGGSATGIGKVQHPDTAIEALDVAFDNLENGFASLFGGLSLPLVGDIGSGIEDFLADLHARMVDPFATALLTDDLTLTTDAIIKTTLESGLTFELAGGEVSVTLPGLTALEVRMELHGTIWEKDVSIDFAGAAPGLGLTIDGDIHLAFTYDFTLGIGVDFTSGDFYLITAGFEDDPLTAEDESGPEEFRMTLEATLPEDFTATGVLGFLQLDIAEFTDDVKYFDDQHDDGQRSGITAEFTVDVSDPDDDGRLTLTEISAPGFSFLDHIVADFHAGIDVDLKGEVSVAGSAVIPRIITIFHYEQDLLDVHLAFGAGGVTMTGLETPTISFEDVTIDLGSFISDFIGPILEKIQVFTEPLQPIIDLLRTDIPIISDLDPLKNALNKDGKDGVSMLDFAGTILGETKYRSVYTAVTVLIELIDLINHIPTGDTVLINFGDFTVAGGSTGVDATKADALKSADRNAVSGANDTSAFDNQNASDTNSDRKGFMQKLKGSGVGKGFEIPLLTSPSAVLGLLMGQNVDLFKFNLPDLEFDFSFRKSTPIVFPLNAIFFGGISATVRLGFGFDTYGIQQFLTSSDPADIFDGFYIDDHGDEGTGGDAAEVELHATIGAGASVGVAGLVEAGVEAGITGTVEFDLNDVVMGAAGSEVGDGKVRIEDFIELTRAGPLCFLDVSGSIDWFLNAFVWVGLDLGFFGRITLWDENFSLGSGNIAEFEHHCPVVLRPNLAHMSGGDLVLHMGTDADQRVTETDGDAAETYLVEYLAAGASLADYNIAGSPATAATNVLVVQYNGYAEVYNAASVGRIVVNDAAGGADSLTVGAGVAANVEFHGGEGDDRVTSQSSGTHTLYGDAGKDRLAVTKAAGHAAGTARLYGGDGDDTLTTSDGNDSVYGGDGNDKIKTGTGNDYVEGGDESVAVSGAKANGDTIDTGVGNDTVYGGTGSDAIKAGDGDDLVYGGDESGLLPSGKALGDSIDAGKGNDTVHAGAGSDALKGGDGDDQLWGGSGDDSFTAGRGIDQVRGEAGGDTIYWTVGDGVDGVIDGGADGDGIIVTGADVDTDIELSNSSGNVLLAWGANGLLTQNTEKFTLNAGQGLDRFTIRDLAGTAAKEISISLGGEIVESTIYDYDGDGTYDDDPPAMLDGEGAVIRDRFGEALLKDVYDDGTPVPYKVVREFADDGKADSVVIYGGAGDDVFSANTARDADGLYVLNVSRQSPSILYSVDQGSVADPLAIDTFTLHTLGGNDNVDFSNVGKDRDAGEIQLLAMTLDGAAGNDLILGTQWNDSLDSGAGDDRVTGNRGVDAFSDASGNDQLIETRDANFAITRGVLTIGAETESTIAPFETVILNGGAGHNRFDVSDWTGTLRMDGAGEGDVYNIHFRGAGDSVITENDSGGTLGTADAIHVFGTSGQDFFFLDANNGDASILTDGYVQVAHGFIGDDGSYHAYGTSETFNYTRSESMDIHAGAGDDYFTVDDVALGLDVYGDEGSDNFVIGRVLEEALVGGIPVATKISNGISVVSRFYGDDGSDDTPVGGYAYGDDYFEVNHNVAEIWLYGDAGDDTFVINAHLTDDDPSDDPLRNVRGGTGNNTISYVQNAAVNIDGGAGNDTVIVNGTAIGDTFIVTTIELEVSPGVFELRQQVVGAGLQIKMTDVERLEVNGAGGNDHIYVFGTLDGLDVTIRGGSGDDTIVIGGAAVTVTVDPPAYIYQPPTQTIDPAPYIDHYDTYSFSWGDYWYWTWSFPFLRYQPLVTYTWSVPVWVDPAPYTVTPAAYEIDPDPIDFTAGPKYTLNESGHAGGTGADAFRPGIRGKLTVDGQLDTDTLVVHNEDGDPADTATFDTTTDDKGLHYHVGGLGMGPDGLTYTRVEQFDLNMGAGDDLVTVTAIDPVTRLTLNLGNGDDVVDLRAMEGDLTINGGAGDDTVNAGSLAPAATGGDLAAIAGELAFAGGTGTDVLNLDDTAATVDQSAVITGSTLAGLGMAAGIVHYEVDTLNLRLGSGADTVEIEGTTAATHLWGNDGDDAFLVSSDGAALAGSLDGVLGDLAIDAGGGGNTLAVSDLGDADADPSAVIAADAITGLAPARIDYTATGGRFTGGVNVWAGRGDDVIRVASTRLDDVTTIHANGGDDAVTVDDLAGGTDRLLAIHGDGGGDTLDASAVTNAEVTVLLFGDSGAETYAGADKRFLTLTGAASVLPGDGGADALLAGTGKAILFGGAAGDTLSGSVADDILIGDAGEVAFVSGVVTRFASLGTAGGDDDIDALGGGNFVIGGAGADSIAAGGGADVALGDNGEVTYTDAGVITRARSLDAATGGGDVLDLGDGANIAVGGFGADTVAGGGGADTLIGDNGEIVYALGIVASFASTDGVAATGGADDIAAGEGDNLVLGGVGADTVAAGTGDDRIIGDNGEILYSGAVVVRFASTDAGAATGAGDTIAAGDGANLVLGGLGADSVAAGNGDDLVIGDNGEARWTAAGLISRVVSEVSFLGGADTVDGGAGDNILVGGFGGDRLDAGSGDDVILGDNGSLDYDGGLLSAGTTDGGPATGGDDRITAGGGRNVVLGGVGRDRIVTGDGEDLVLGDSGVAEFSGGVLARAGNDATIDGGDDQVDLGGGNDVAIGGDGSDGLSGQAGDDILMGDGGHVSYVAGGLSEIEGDSAIGGDDTLMGGAGADIMLGGKGADTMDGDLAEDLIIGDNARIRFSGGLVTSIELLGSMDLVLEQLFALYETPADAGVEATPGEAAAALAAVLAGAPESDTGDGEAGVPRLVATGSGLELILGGARPLASLPAAMSNALIDLILGHPEAVSSGGATESSDAPPEAPPADGAPAPAGSAAAAAVTPVAQAPAADWAGGLFDPVVPALAAGAPDALFVTVAPSADGPRQGDAQLWLAGLLGAAAGNGRTRVFDPASGTWRIPGPPARQAALRRAA
ncbi:MAG: DUF4347 domain-containing protein [Rhodocyclaceae bacterium]|nr:DUF4347 domain-containing protein [Rhodocyclaceae bacterium]